MLAFSLMKWPGILFPPAGDETWKRKNKQKFWVKGRNRRLLWAPGLPLLPKMKYTADLPASVFLEHQHFQEGRTLDFHGAWLDLKSMLHALSESYVLSFKKRKTTRP